VFPRSSWDDLGGSVIRREDQILVEDHGPAVPAQPEREHCHGEPARRLPARQHPAAASRRKTPMMRVIQLQEFKLPDTSCAPAVNMCELATAAMP
jgi:hypothetical protein